MKRRISTLLAASVIAVAAMTGCGSSNSADQSNAPASNEATDVAAETKEAEKDSECSEATAPGESGFTEIEIGEAQEVAEAHMEVAAVYFQAVDMLPPDQMPAADADIHLEADIATTDGYYGFGAGAWVPYLTVDYDVLDESGASVASGTFMPMNADDGPHYGDNIKMPGAGAYKLELTIHSPAENGFLLHSDSETGVDAGKDGSGFWNDPVKVSYDWDYTPLS
ncbi:MAG: iron transporter [Firmicutes bacterium]|nr:iron transporter [Bacillota bacterium]